MRPLSLNVIAGDPSDTAVYSPDYYFCSGYWNSNRRSSIPITPESTTATISISTISDGVDDPDQETFTLKVIASSVPLTNILSSPVIIMKQGHFLGRTREMGN